MGTPNASNISVWPASWIVSFSVSAWDRGMLETYCYIVANRVRHVAFSSASAIGRSYYETEGTNVSFCIYSIKTFSSVANVFAMSWTMPFSIRGMETPAGRSSEAPTRVPTRTTARAIILPARPNQSLRLRIDGKQQLGPLPRLGIVRLGGVDQFVRVNAQSPQANLAEVDESVAGRSGSPAETVCACPRVKSIDLRSLPGGASSVPRWHA